LLEEFYLADGCRLGVRPECRRCTLDAQAARYRENPQSKISYAATYRRTHIERNREWQRTYYERHREEIREKAKHWARAWRAANQPRRRELEARRRARKCATRVAPVDLTAILRTHGRACHICHRPIEQNDLEFDHVVPLSRGGHHVEDNIRPAHRSCNRRKYNKIL
jgi:5-methylcytosine-specific restriction endonuclease McrA